MAERSKVSESIERIRRGGGSAAHEKAAAQSKLFVRERIARLLDRGSFIEDALFANANDAELPADGPNRQQTWGIKPESRTWL